MELDFEFSLLKVVTKLQSDGLKVTVDQTLKSRALLRKIVAVVVSIYRLPERFARHLASALMQSHLRMRVWYR